MGGKPRAKENLLTVQIRIDDPEDLSTFEVGDLVHAGINKVYGRRATGDQLCRSLIAAAAHSSALFCFDLDQCLDHFRAEYGTVWPEGQPGTLDLCDDEK